MQVSFGVKGRGGNSLGETGRLGHERAPGKARGLATGAAVASPGSCHGGLVLLARARFTAGECLLQTPRTGGLRFLHGEGGLSSGGLRSKRSHSLLGWFSIDFTELKPPGPSLPPRGRVGEFPPKADFAAQAERRPDCSWENPSMGVEQQNLRCWKMKRWSGW